MITNNLPPNQGDQNTTNIEEPALQIDKYKEFFPIVVGIGASAGGLEALEKFFANMPPDSGMTFIIIMHFDPKAKSVMPDILKRFTNMEVFQIDDGMNIKHNCIYIIPPNKDLGILHGLLHLYEPVVHKGIRHPIDFFFRSLADDQKEKAICIILSGTGTEGTLGLKAIKGEGGMVIVQSIESSVYDGMPRSAISTELADFILPPEKMPEQLLNYVKQIQATGIIPEKTISEHVVNSLQKIIILIRDNIGLDFSHYKQGTLIRRIERRMNLHQIDKIADYVRYLQENQPEVYILYKEFLIGVTSFFRDPMAFESLKKNAISEILKDKSLNQPVRCWVAACSTGEEAYSMAMIFKEYLDELRSNIKIQIFATDVDREAIEVARTGAYPDNIAIDISPERLSSFFVKKLDPSGYNIKKDIREMVVFAHQNVISDPPFLNIDLISCRNLLIYLVPDIQKKLLHLFHYSMTKTGFLFLGSSETIGDLTDIYNVVDKKWKIFRSIGEKVHLPIIAPPVPVPKIATTRETRPHIRIAEQAEKVLLATYAPSSVIVNGKGDILYIHGKTGKYLEPTSGRPNWNILEMVREGIRTELNIALHTVITQKKDAIFRNLKVKINGGYQTIDLTVKPIMGPEIMAGLLLISFEDIPEHEVLEEKPIQPKEIKKYVSDMEKELISTKENLQATIEEMQASNEELRSTNEELQSANEELQSTNEELNASKEELQSLNEELITLNAEHQSKIEELSTTVSDLSNVISSNDIATIFLDNELRIKGFTPIATKIINLIRTDVGRPISDISTNLNYDHLAKDAEEVLRNLTFVEKEVLDNKYKKWYLMKVLPYRTSDNIIEGVVVTFIDISEKKRCEKEAKTFTDNIADNIRESLLVLDKDFKIIKANKSFYKTFHISSEDTAKYIVNRQWNIPELIKKLDETIQKGTMIKDYTIEHEFPDIGRKVMLINANKIYQQDIEMVLLTIEDITK